MQPRCPEFDEDEDDAFDSPARDLRRPFEKIEHGTQESIIYDGGMDAPRIIIYSELYVLYQ